MLARAPLAEAVRDAMDRLDAVAMLFEVFARALLCAVARLLWVVARASVGETLRSHN